MIGKRIIWEIKKEIEKRESASIAPETRVTHRRKLREDQGGKRVEVYTIMTREEHQELLPQEGRSTWAREADNFTEGIIKDALHQLHGIIETMIEETRGESRNRIKVDIHVDEVEKEEEGVVEGKDLKQEDLIAYKFSTIIRVKA